MFQLNFFCIEEDVLIVLELIFVKRNLDENIVLTQQLWKN